MPKLPVHDSRHGAIPIPSIPAPNGPGFAGLYAGDVVEWQPARWEHTHTSTVLALLVFPDHVQVRFGNFGATVDARNFVRLVRRGKRHIAADKANLANWRQGGTERTRA